MKKKTRIIKKAKAFVRQKAGKTVRIQALDLCIPIKDYKKVVNRTLNRRVKNNTVLKEEDLQGLIYFINKVIPIVDKTLGTNKKIREGRKINPWDYNELLEFLGKSYKKKDKMTFSENEGYEGLRTENSVRPVKHRTNRTQ